MECPEWEKTHEDHGVQVLALHRHPDNPTLCLTELWQPWGCDCSLGSPDIPGHQSCEAGGRVIELGLHSLPPAAVVLHEAFLWMKKMLCIFIYLFLIFMLSIFIYILVS